MARRFQQVDVFTDRLGYGNPLAVVLDADGLSEHAMARFAAWTNLSETTFVFPPTDPAADYLVRIFTPTQELPFAGHPTIGTCHAWLRAGGQPRSGGHIVQQCGVGLVTLRPIDGRLAFATPPLSRSGPVAPADLQDVMIALGVGESDVIDNAWIDNGPGWIGVRLDSVERLRALSPDLSGTEHKIGAVALTGSDDPAIEVRAFFYAGATREDPVTGSVNGSIAQWLIGDGTVSAPYTSSQGTSMGRDGRIYVHQDQDGIWIGGDAVTGIEGEVGVEGGLGG